MKDPKEYTQETLAEGEGRFSSGKRKEPGKTKALLLLILSVLSFVAAVSISGILIYRSGEGGASPVTEPTVGKPLNYLVNEIPTQPITQGAEDENPIDLQAPKSQYASPVVNILLMGVEEDRNDTLILCSIHLAERSMNLLAIPRDTYVAGDYDVPKISSVYSAFQPEKRVEAVMDAVKGMFGFAPDYYLILDETFLGTMVELSGGVEFDIPQEPAYHSLKEGEYSFTKEDAFALFRFQEDWEEIGAEPTKVQRDFLLKLFTAFLEDESKISANCIALAQVAQTDMTMEELAYLAFLMADYNFEDVNSSSLPGEENKIDKELYYQVDPEKAVEILNEYHNPLKKELSVFNVNFRQEQKDSGEGKYSQYGYTTKTEASTAPTTKGTTSTEAESRETEPTKNSSSEESQVPETSGAMEEPTPTEETPTQSEAPTEATQATTEATQAPSTETSTTADTSADDEG